MGGFLPRGKYIATTPCSTRSAGRCWQDRSQPRPGRGLHRGPGPGPGRSVGPAAASVGLASSRRGPGRLSSRRSPGRRQRWPGPRYPPGVQLCGGAAPRARLGRRQRSIGPGRAVDQGGSVRDVCLGGGSVEDLGLVQGDRWGWPRHRRSWPARGVGQGGGSGGPGHGTPPRRSTLRWTCPGRALGEVSGRSGLGAPWTRAAQLATSAWAVAPSRTWA